MTSTAIVELPLSFMQRLSPCASLYIPQDPPLLSSDESSSKPAPKLIIILSWFAALEVHIAKYVAEHRLLFPTSRILLIRCPINHAFVPSGIKAQLEPALSVIKAQQEELGKDSEEGGVLVHMFSNGGMNTMNALLDMLSKMEDDSVGFPRHVMIHDSNPGYYNHARYHRALMQALPFYFSPLIHLGLGLGWFVGSGLLRREPPSNIQAKRLNSKPFASLQVRRLYLYGDGDEMVHWKDIEDHADKGVAAGVDVRKEMFPGGKHVAHVRVDKDRYWLAVKHVWEGDY